MTTNLLGIVTGGVMAAGYAAVPSRNVSGIRPRSINTDIAKLSLSRRFPFHGGLLDSFHADQCAVESADGFAFCPYCGAPLAGRAPPAREVRKTVTVLFCDVTGSTALGESTGPEALRALLARFFERMKGIESHGGTVEKLIGDAVMSGLGFP